VAETATSAARALSGAELNGVVGAPCRWLPDGTGLICRTVAAARGQAPRRATIPTGPITQESEGRAAPNRTYQDLLQSPTDEALFDYYFTSQIVRINLDGSRSPLGRPAIHTRAEPSPDGQHLLVQTIHRPYSYLVPLFRFPTATEVWNLTGSVVARVADVGLQEEVPASFDAVTSGPREVSWRADAPATLLWAEAVDGGDPRQQVAVRDEVRLLAAPFVGPPTVLAGLALRHAGTLWGPGGMALVSERWNRTSQTRTWMIRLGAAPKTIFERSSEDRYGDPGSFLTTTAPGGTQVLQTTPDGRYAFLEGSGASEEGDR
ncbi:MAG: S9 family peptidase, partial [Gemmatimonadota bacterium]